MSMRGQHLLGEDRSVDRTLLGAILLLAVIGIVTVYSAGSERSMQLYGSPHHLFLNQLVRAFVGIGLLLVVQAVRFHNWRYLSWPALGLAAAMLVMTHVPGLAVEGKGAHRWLQLGPIVFQPSEVARYALILFLATWAAEKGERMKEFRIGVLIPMVPVLLFAGLIVMQPDFSTAAMLVATALVLLFIAHARLAHLAMVVGSLGAVGGAIVAVTPHMRARIMQFLQPGTEVAGADYQLTQSLIGLGRGGLFGVGIGSSRQKLFFLPDAHTDFIYSILGEEWGLFGTAGLLVIFLFMILRGFRVAARCPDPFGGYLAAGIVFTVGSYAVANMAIAVGALPATGLPLPLISYGGTSLMMTLAALGIVLNISRHQAPRAVRSAGEGGAR